MAVSPDNNRIASSAGGEIRLWEAPQPVADDAPLLRQQIEAATAMTIDEHGRIQRLTSDDWQTRRQP
jgi:hypothetical protein